MREDEGEVEDEDEDEGEVEGEDEGEGEADFKSFQQSKRKTRNFNG